MVRKSKVRRSVNALGVKKHQLAGKLGDKNLFDWLQNLLPRKYAAGLYKLSELFFHIFIKIGCNLSFVPISIDCDGRLTLRKTKRELGAHYLILVFQTIRFMHMFGVTGSRALSKVLDLTTFLCLGSLMAYIVGFCVSSSLLLRPQDTVQLINTTPRIFSFYPKNGKPTSMFQNAKNTILILTIVAISTIGPLLMSAFGFVVDELPVSLYHIVESITGRPEFIPYFLWKLFYWPFEFAMFLHTIMLAGISSMILSTLPNIVLACSQEMRKMLVNTVDSWEELRRKYHLLQVYLCLCNSWIKFMIVPGIFSVSGTIIIAIYITLRHTEIPILIYLGIALLGVALLILKFWFGFEVITFIQSTEAIVGMLNNKDQSWFLELDQMDRLYLAKYGKCTRQAIFDIGDFTDYSIGVPVNIWEEILNQLMLLLTF